MTRPTPRARHNLTFTGSYLQTKISYLDSTENPINLSNYSSVMYVRNSPKLPPLFKLTDTLNADGSGIDMMDSVFGNINLLISSFTSSLMPDIAYYSIDIYSGSLYVGLLEGKIIRM